MEIYGTIYLPHRRHVLQRILYQPIIFTAKILFKLPPPTADIVSEVKQKLSGHIENTGSDI